MLILVKINKLNLKKIIYPHFSPLGNCVQLKEKSTTFQIKAKFSAETCEFGRYEHFCRKLLPYLSEEVPFPGKLHHLCSCWNSLPFWFLHQAKCKGISSLVLWTNFFLLVFLQKNFYKNLVFTSTKCSIFPPQLTIVNWW